MTANEILCTTDYGMFKWHREQRGLKSDKVLQMMKSMQKRGFIPTKPIEVNAKFEIMDGQYRFQAAKNLGICAYYIVSENISIEDVREMARESNKWDTEDYITSYIRQGNETYIELMRWKNKLDLTWSKLFRTGILISPGSRLSEQRQALYNGTLTISKQGRERIEAFETHYKDIRPVNRRVTEQTDFIGALSFLVGHENYKPEQMIQRLEYQSTRLVKCVDTKDYVELLASIYNHGSHKKNLVDFSYPPSNYLRRG